MNQKESLQNADFLSIALEEMERGNYDTAEDFVQAVYENLLEYAEQ